MNFLYKNNQDTIFTKKNDALINNKKTNITFLYTYFTERF